LRSFLKLLAYNGIKYQTFSRPNFDTININNFYIKHYHHQIGDPQTTLFEMYAEYLDLANKKPTRDVYLSRTLSHSPQESDENSLRIDDERALEKYFSSLGFDIIYPEDFRDLDEQICFFHGVRTLVSLTSSGITGATFMQPGQTVIELVTPMVINFPDENNYYESTRIEELHHFYVFMCFRKNHKYMAISNETKNAKKLIKSLESDDIFKAFLNRSRSRRWFKK
jgi:capsular polysaccharide biosynthesis protein